MATAISIHKNMALRDAIRAAQDLGVAINHCHGTGDLCFWFASRQLMVNCRRKSAPQMLISKLRQIQKQRDAQLVLA